MISPVPLIKVTRNGRILWKHGPNGLFYALMVSGELILYYRTMLY